MPKVIVLFFGAESPAVTLAEAAAQGAKEIRFSEVVVRSGGPHEATTPRPHARLESPAEMRDVDGVIFACPAAGDIPSELGVLLDDLDRSSMGPLTNTVFGIVGGENTTLAARVLRLGGIVVSEPTGIADPHVRAKRLGARVATVVGWVRHALSHEHGHQHHEHAGRTESDRHHH